MLRAVLGLRRERKPLAHLGVGEQVDPVGDPDRRSPERRADQPGALAGEHDADHSASGLLETGLSDLAQRDRGAAGLPLRLEPDHGRPVRRKRQPVEDADPRNERAGRVLEIGPARPWLGR